MAVDPNDPNKIVIGWRQFNSVQSDFREAGWAYSHDGGWSWTFPGTLDPGEFGSDPVLEPDAEGRVYYLTFDFDELRLFRSQDSGCTWTFLSQVWNGYLDKPWMAIDRTTGIGRGHIYVVGRSSALCRSTDGGRTFQRTLHFDNNLGTLTVGPDGALYQVDYFTRVGRSDDAQDPRVSPTLAMEAQANLGILGISGAPNPGGLLGQVWILADHSSGPTRGRVYVLCSCGQGEGDPTEVAFACSADRGVTWRQRPAISPSDSWQWFGMMDVAPNGRIDALWNDTRNTGEATLSELFYAFSLDGGESWSDYVPVSPVFDSRIGLPGGSDKLGDYYDLTSDERGVNVAYAATFNGEQDVYFLRIPQDCNFNEIPDADEIAAAAADCDDNLIPDECETFGDCTCDWIVTLPDYAALRACLAGPAAPRAAGCLCADSRRDGHVDLADFAKLQRWLGPR
ncbi:MAG: hypothetical protein HY763_12845 [Planctomycetes bacterium]|nr:hypothetical protein [Planctomycetota bacterium]